MDLDVVDGDVSVVVDVLVCAVVDVAVPVGVSAVSIDEVVEFSVLPDEDPVPRVVVGGVVFETPCSRSGDMFGPLESRGVFASHDVHVDRVDHRVARSRPEPERGDTVRRTDRARCDPVGEGVVGSNV